jgi:molybdopterin synthase sulfur carrier subunit
MKVQVQFFSHLKDIVGASDLEVDVAEGTNVDELLALLYEREPPLRAWDGSILIGAGLEFVGRDYVIKSGDEIAIMPPVQGG